jgi:AraC-like DNA-binding protein
VKSRQHGISVAFLRPLAELIGKAGEEPNTFLAALGVDARTSPNTYVPAARVDDELAAIAERRGDPALALTLAKYSVARPLGLFGHMVWLSGTLGDALERAVKHFGMVTQRTKLRLDRSGRLVRLRAIVVSRDIPRGRVLTEFPFASLALRAREVTGGAFALRAVRFAHAGKPTAVYSDVFRAPVTFNAGCDELELDAAQLLTPLASADRITSEVLEAKVAQLAIIHDPFVDRVHQAAREQVAPTPTAVARALGISSRTLRRRLDEQGQTFRGVIDRVRRERADDMLARGTPVKEVAFALGFSDPSAFSRAYKRWTGRAPKQASAR